MIYGIGVDIVSLARIENLIERKSHFIDRVLTEKELLMFEKMSYKRKKEFLGGRFACKEAFSKAYGTGIGPISFKDIEILSDSHGRPVITTSPFKGIVHVSISHTDEMAIAQIVLEKEELS